MKRVISAYFFGLFITFTEVTGWSCVSTVGKVFSQVNTDAVLWFDISADVNQETLGTFPVKFHDGSVQAFVIFRNGVITTDKISGVQVTADMSGNVVVTKENIGINNAGIYYISSSSTPSRCSCLYILGTPTQPSVSVARSSSIGGSATLTCTSTSTTTPSNHSLNFIYNWRVDTIDNPSGSRYSYSINRNTLTLSNIVKDDANKQFTCTSTEDVSGGYTSSRSDSMSLDVHYGPEDINFRPKTTNYERYESTILDSVTCSARCNPPCSFKWTKVGDDAFVSNNAVLSLGMLSSSTAGTYRCIAMRTGGPDVTKDLTVNVIYTTVQSFYIEEHADQDNVSVDEHDPQIEFKCIVNSNTPSTTKIMFEGALLKEETSVTSLSFTRKDISCSDAGAYTCKGRNDYGGTSFKTVFLSVRCVPRPKGQTRRNLTSEMYSSVTLSFTAIAYPEPGSKGFAWQKEESVGWVPLLSNDHLKISSSELQSNLTVMNVSEEDYGTYRVTVTNNIGSYVQHLFLSEEISAQQTDRQCKCQTSDQTALIVGISLGIVCCVLASVSTYLAISRMRTVTKESRSLSKTKKQSAYANTSFATDVIERHEYENPATDQGESISQSQYTDLCRYPNSDKDTYDVIKKV